MQPKNSKSGPATASIKYAKKEKPGQGVKSTPVMKNKAQSGKADEPTIYVGHKYQNAAESSKMAQLKPKAVASQPPAKEIHQSQRYSDDFQEAHNPQKNYESATRSQIGGEKTPMSSGIEEPKVGKKKAKNSLDTIAKFQEERKKESMVPLSVESNTPPVDVLNKHGKAPKAPTKAPKTANIPITPPSKAEVGDISEDLEERRKVLRRFITDTSDELDRLLEKADILQEELARLLRQQAYLNSIDPKIPGSMAYLSRNNGAQELSSEPLAACTPGPEPIVDSSDLDSEFGFGPQHATNGRAVKPNLDDNESPSLIGKRSREGKGAPHSRPASNVNHQEDGLDTALESESENSMDDDMRTGESVEMGMFEKQPDLNDNYGFNLDGDVDMDDGFSDFHLEERCASVSSDEESDYRRKPRRRQAIMVAGSEGLVYEDRCSPVPPDVAEKVYKILDKWGYPYTRPQGEEAPPQKKARTEGTSKGKDLDGKKKNVKSKSPNRKKGEKANGVSKPTSKKSNELTTSPDSLASASKPLKNPSNGQAVFKGKNRKAEEQELKDMEGRIDELEEYFGVGEHDGGKTNKRKRR
ncbi:hypothetical protein ABW19_dt0202061 [Dactylella cylindrospora]|nr:hypothetical protein ABW19_dt0202061 [Dactylella cylindrospora]